MRKIEIGLLFAIAVIMIGVITSSLFNTNSTGLVQNQYTSDNADSGIGYHSAVCIYKNGVLVQPCEHNLFTNMGANMTRDRLSAIVGTKIDVIALSNVTSPQGKNNLTSPGEYGYKGNASCGLVNTTGTVSADALAGVSGNWSIANTFTSTCNNVIVNGTALYNSTTEANRALFAHANFTDVTLQNADQITVTWYVWVTG